MKLSIHIIVCIITISGNLFCQSWELVWNDEFSGTNIDLTKWEYEVNGEGGGNNELQYYTDRELNSLIDDGKLVIIALKETYTGPDGTREYTSARLRTKYKGDWKYGRFEIRAKLPIGQGLWPAIWMLPTDWVYGGWAASGEIDIMELLGQDPVKVYGTLHYGGEWPNNVQSGDSYTLTSGSFTSAFHIFAVEWEENEFRWYLDDILYQTQNVWYSEGGAYPAPFDQRFHILLNVAVGGNWPGPPDASTVFPQRMEVDYVRVYEKVTDVYDESHNPVKFDLHQNYPNPFNPETIIGYSLPSESLVRINLYNTLGENVAEIVNGVKEVGSHEVVFNANHFPSGIYFYKIQVYPANGGASVITSDFSSADRDASQGFSETKKMILLR